MKKWFENYWYHYKWLTLALIFVIILLFAGLRSCANRSETDLHIVYFSNTPLHDTEIEALKKSLINNNVVKDLDGDGEISIHVEPITHSFDVDDSLQQGTPEKLQTMLYAGEHTLVLAHEYALEDYSQFFENIYHKATGHSKTYVNPLENYISGISVEDNTYLERIGINTENLYVAMRRMRNNEKNNKKIQKHYDQGYKAMDFILRYND